MKWTKDLPKKDGYYWFAVNYQDAPICLYFTVTSGEVVTYGYFYNDPLYADTDKGYYFSDECVQPLEW